ncbi:MAG: hypothetical protein LBD59_00535 [Prevotellaceae bacterium]|jgi:hypothetical protein|nr:hypothetical protein [Prevotellaceae bacterium]
MKNLLKITAIMLIMAGAFACGKDDTDMSQIDFSNIENLYAQPLPVIQKAVQGKWIFYSCCGGDAGCIYPENNLIEFTSNEIITDIGAAYHLDGKYSWKNKNVQIGEKVYSTYILWPDEADKTGQQGEVFISIKNDTLYSRSYSLTSDYTVFVFTYVRQK